MSLGIKYFLTIQPLSKKFVHVFMANKVLIGAKINTHKLVLKTVSKPPDMTSIGNATF